MLAHGNNTHQEELSLSQNNYTDLHLQKPLQIMRNHDTGGSKGSIQAISMRDESAMQMSAHSVTDERFIVRDGNHDATSFDSNEYTNTKRQMLRYMSRVADKNKPLFVFNQKLNLNDLVDESDTGTPSFSLVALMDQWEIKEAQN